MCALPMYACADGPPASGDVEDAILVGAALPFSGPRATTGFHIERALTLAVEDVNRAGGIGGRPLRLIVRDTNSGSQRGLGEILSLLYEDNVRYLIGPEEDHLALEVVRDVKGLDVMHLLPGYSAPTITDSGDAGAWVRLTPSPRAMGCALATKAYEDGIRIVRTITTRDDYHLQFSTIFSSTLGRLGGRAMPTVTVEAGRSSYSSAVSQVAQYEADATLLLAYPETAASIVAEMADRGFTRWYLSPMLRDEAFVWNAPEGLIDGSVGASPSLSHGSECAAVSDGGEMHCDRGSAEAFTEHFAERWQGGHPLPVAHFYYDTLVLLALSLRAASEAGLHDPRPRELLPYVTSASRSDGEPTSWRQMDGALQRAAEGEPINYVGAAGEYDFNSRGQNVRALVSSWFIKDEQITESESVSCIVRALID